MIVSTEKKIKGSIKNNDIQIRNVSSGRLPVAVRLLEVGFGLFEK